MLQAAGTSAPGRTVPSVLSPTTSARTASLISVSHCRYFTAAVTQALELWITTLTSPVALLLRPRPAVGPLMCGTRAYLSATWTVPGYPSTWRPARPGGRAARLAVVLLPRRGRYPLGVRRRGRLLHWAEIVDERGNG